MPRIIVRSESTSEGAGVITLDERIAAAELDSGHRSAELIERLGWAVHDADDVEGDDRAAGELSTPMSPEIRFIAHDDRGRELLYQLEAETGALPLRTDDRTGERAYALDSTSPGTEEFDAVLNRLDPDWNQHLSRS